MFVLVPLSLSLKVGDRDVGELGSFILFECCLLQQLTSQELGLGEE
jgi:hypothetical protein